MRPLHTPSNKQNELIHNKEKINKLSFEENTSTKTFHDSLPTKSIKELPIVTDQLKQPLCKQDNSQMNHLDKHPKHHETCRLLMFENLFQEATKLKEDPSPSTCTKANKIKNPLQDLYHCYTCPELMDKETEMRKDGRYIFSKVIC